MPSRYGTSGTHNSPESHKGRRGGRRRPTTAPDAPLLLQGLRDLLRDRDGGRVEAMVPVTVWSVEALQREGFGVHPAEIYAKAL